MVDKFKKNYLHNQGGYTLVSVVMILLVISILGVSILSVTAGTLKISSSERDNQSAYYIAEAGLNKKLAEINTYVNGEWDMENTYRENDFETVFGEQPRAEVVVEAKNGSNETRQYYTITSRGIIGKETRIVEQDFYITEEDGKSGSGDNSILDLAALIYDGENGLDFGNNFIIKGKLGVIDGDKEKLEKKYVTNGQVNGIVKKLEYPSLSFSNSIPVKCPNLNTIDFVNNDCINLNGKKEFFVSNQKSPIKLGIEDKIKILFVDNLIIDTKFELSGAGKLLIYVNGDLKFGNSNGRDKYAINKDGEPDKLDIVLKKESNEQIVFKNTTVNASIYAKSANLVFDNSDIKGIIYTENGEVVVNPGTATITGTVIANSLSSGNSNGIYIEHKKYEGMKGPIYDALFGNREFNNGNNRKSLKVSGAVREI